MENWHLIWLLSGLDLIKIDFWRFYGNFKKNVKFSEKTSTFLKKIRKPVTSLLRACLFFFCPTIYQKTRKKKIEVTQEHILDSWLFFRNWMEFFQKMDFWLYFLVFLHLSKSQKWNVLVLSSHFCTLIFHELISYICLN